MRPDRGRGLGDRSQQTRATLVARGRRASHRGGGAWTRVGPLERGAQTPSAVVSGRCLHQRPSHLGWHGGQQLLRQPLHRLRQHGAQRAGRPSLVVRWQFDRLGPACAKHGPRTRDRGLFAAIGHPLGPRHRSPLPQGAAPRGRLQPGHFSQPKPTALHRRWVGELGAPFDRQRRHAGLDTAVETQAQPLARHQSAGGGQLPQLPSSHGCRAAHRPTRRAGPTDGGGVGRSHHDRALAAKPRVCPHRAHRPDR